MKPWLWRISLWVLAVCIALLVIPLAVIAYWTLLVTSNDIPTQLTALRVLAASVANEEPERTPIIVVHGLWGGDSDQESVCAATDGPFAYTTLVDNHQYVPLQDLGPWLIEDGYMPYYAILTTAPGYTPTFEENGRCLEEQLRNLTTQLGNPPGQKFTIIAHSMGGLVARACLAQSDFCRSVVERVITMGTPHNGAPALFAWKPGSEDCSADPGLCQMADPERIAAFNVQTTNLAEMRYLFIGGTQGLLKHIPLLRENDGLVSAWSAVGMIFTADEQPQWAEWTKPNLPTAYFVANKHTISRRVGYAYYEAPGPGQVSEAYTCIRYELGILTEPPDVCRSVGK